MQLITCIIERGKADVVVDSALKSGAQAATIYYARGRGVREHLGFVGKLIQPEKEVVLIVTKPDQTQKVFETVIEVAKLNQPGKGFAYVQPVQQAVGFID
ncbi:MAG: P-II family nitrogen regulator [Endomicrobiales bacterium]|nr:P-II family nitrogen regulator [Endomicrobiales bacterium]